MDKPRLFENGGGKGLLTLEILLLLLDYWKRTIEVKKGAQVERFFNPLHVLATRSQCLGSRSPGSRLFIVTHGANIDFCQANSAVANSMQAQWRVQKGKELNDFLRNL